MKTPKISPASGKLVGLYFHAIKNEKLSWQGIVVGNPEPGFYIVQLFEWLAGGPNVARLVRIEDMAGWYFYPTKEMFDFSFEHGLARTALKGAAKPGVT